jgi:hypothetical protein
MADPGTKARKETAIKEKREHLYSDVNKTTTK